MRFNDQSPIYEQIADALAADTASGRIPEGERLPSARELAASLQVNANTAARALQALAERGIARAERGSGYFVADDGPERARQSSLTRFYDVDLPIFFRKLDELDLKFSDLVPLWLKRKEV